MVKLSLSMRLGWAGALGCGLGLLGCGGDDASGATGAGTTTSTTATTGSGGAGGASTTTTTTSAGGAGGGATTTTTGSGGAGGASSSVPLLDAALDGQCPAGSKPPGHGVGPGDDLHKVTLSGYPDAVCNDGSPAIMYVRRAATPAAETSWIIHLQAGGACSDWQVCRDRWCSHETSYDAAKMSSKYAPMATGGSGMFSRGPKNQLGPANQVYVYYCSSDQWVGRAPDRVLADPDGAGPTYRLHFRGFDIVQAVDDALRKGVTSDDGVETLPKLVDATRILFAGSSAGSAGQTHALDWWASRHPKAQTAGFFDASTDPLVEDIVDPVFAQKLASSLPIRHEQNFVGLYDAHLDESCVAAHPGEDAYLCSHGGHVRLNHVTTPFFVRHDLTDPVQFKAYGLQGLSLVDFAASVRKTVLRYDDLLSTAEEKGAMKRAPGVHVSDCGQHIVALNGPWFGVAASGNATVEDPSGTPTTVHDALASWASGEAFHAYDTHPSTKSTCAAVTDDQ